MPGNNYKKNRMPARAGRLLLGLGVLLVQPSHALQSLDEAELAGVSGQDGLALTISSNDLSVIQMDWTVDSGNSYEAALRASQLTLNGVDSSGNLSGPFSLQADLDAGSNASEPGLALGLNLARSRLRLDSLSPAAEAGRSYGTVALDLAANLQLSNSRGLFDNSGTQVRLHGEVQDGKLFYRQLGDGHPYLILNHLNALWDIDGGTLGISSAGLRTAAALIDVALDFDLLYKTPSAETAFTITGSERPLLHFGWLGALKDAELVWKAGGLWYGTAGSPTVFDQNNKSQGLHLSARWNFANHADTLAGGGSLDNSREFRWQLGEAGSNPGDGVRLELSDWRNLPGVAYGFNFPLIALDVINAAQGPGGLCWGGPQHGPDSAGGACTATATRQYIDLAAGDIASFDPSAPRSNAQALALAMRGGNLLAYSNRIKLLEDGVVARTFDWGLIYTLANLDANIYLYAGGNPDDGTRGLIADILLMSQSFSAADPSVQGLNWSQGSHLMIADTNVGGTGSGKGIGLMGVSLLLAANDTRIWLKPQVGTDHYTGGLDLLSPQARVNLRGTFGGGNLPDGSGLLRAGLVNLNLEGLLNVRLSPSRAGATIAADGGTDFLGYSLAARLQNTNIARFSESTAGDSTDDGSFFSFAEPSSPSTDLRLANISGDIALVNGVFDLRATDEEGDSRPKLVVSQGIQFGSTANARLLDGAQGASLPGGNTAQPFTIGRVEFGNRDLGKIVIPSGQWGSTLTLQPQ